MTVQLVVEITEAELARLTEQNEAGHSFSLRCGSVWVWPARVRELTP